MQIRLERSIISVALVGLAFLGCGVSIVGSAKSDERFDDASDLVSPPASSAHEAGFPSTPVSDGGLFSCGDVMVETCAGCEAGAAACPATRSCVSDCSSECPSAPVGCIGCAGGVASGTCEPPSSAGCIADPAYTHCGCATAAECPGANQVCVESTCRSCGEPGTHEATCRDGTGARKCKVTDPHPEHRLRCR